jgi:two-component system, OmpR family, KDP operon response regulator KdpE
MASERVLIVDDELAIRTYMRIALTAQGYQVFEAENGFEAVEMARAHNPDAVFLDMGLPDVTGLEVTRNLRSWTWTPIIFISVRDDESTKVQALDAGADDYLTKPFGLEEMMARLRAVLRRKLGVPSDGQLRCGTLTMDQNNRIASFGDERLPLTPNEFLILQVLMRNCGKLVSHRQILVEVWGPAYAEASDVLRVNIFNLRKKLEREPHSGRILVNEPGLGYRLLDGT